MQVCNRDINKHYKDRNKHFMYFIRNDMRGL